MARTPEPWERYRSLRALVRPECCNFQGAARHCVMTERPCDALVRGQPRRRWRSPLSKNPHRVPKPRTPVGIASASDLSRFLRRCAAAQEPQETSG